MEKLRDGIEAPHCGNSVSEGILGSLRSLYKLNLHSLNIVRVTASSISPSSLKKPFEILNTEWPGSWLSCNIPQSWIQLDFIKLVVDIQAYAIHCDSSGAYAPRMTSFALMGSYDRKSWFALDEKRKISWIGDKFEADITERKIRAIRLIQTEENSNQNFCLSLKFIEIFGRVTPDK